MKTRTSRALLALTAIFICAAAADAQIVRRAGENAAGGVTVAGAHDVRGPYRGRSAGEGGVVTNGDGAGAGGSRGCSRGAAGARGCRSGATVRDEDGDVRHQHDAYARGAYGGSASSHGTFERDGDGGASGSRNTDVHVGDRTYSAETTFDSEDGFDRDVSCSGC